MPILRTSFVIRFLLATASLGVSVPAIGGPDSSRTLDALADCQRVTGDAARLTCFDAIAARIVSAQKSGDLLALDREEVVERKRRQFGLADAARHPLGGGEADRLTKVTEVHTTIVDVRPASYARFLVQLANGSVWETTEPLTFAPDKGAAIVIRQSGLGGFKASIAGERPILIKRQR